MSEAITHGSGNNGWKLCKCSECGVESVCTPSFDFYVRTGDESEALVCERCFLAPFQKPVLQVAPIHRNN